MEKTLKLLLTDSYYNIFPILTKELNGKVKSLDAKNLVFCEEKISLMTERWLCGELGGSFNTDVYSFGNYLRAQKNLSGVLSKEGSAMAIKRILSQISLRCFRSSKTYLAPALYDLIAQLKSAKVTPNDLFSALDKVNGGLKNKLSDIAEIYLAYETFLAENGYEDQSSALSYLPEIIKNKASLKNTDVYLVGYSSWTSQARSVIDELLNTAKSVTAILTQGQNEFVFVNETVSAILALCNKNGVSVKTTVVKSDYTAEGKMLIDHAFNPLFGSNSKEKFSTERITVGEFSDIEEEITRVAEEIKLGVVTGGYRWKDFTVALSDTAVYRDTVERVFTMLGIPYFFDEKKRAEAHPLITLILSYIEAFRKSLDKTALSSFYKNPLVTADKQLADDFENYVLKYNVNYSKIKEPFKFDCDVRPLSELEEFRQYICAYFDKFDVEWLLESLRVEDKLSALSTALNEYGEADQSAISKQIYQAVNKLLGEMRLILDNVSLPLAEYKNVFLSGVVAMDLSIIPQYSDAVFVGGFKETALAKAKRLFVCGLTSDVPNVQSDVALLSDRDIDVLDGVNVLVEPKIRVVNHRSRENVGMAISAFSEKIYLSYPTTNGTLKSQIVTLAERLFTVKNFSLANGYLSKAQGMDSFAKDCGKYVSGTLTDFVLPTSFSEAVGSEFTKSLLNGANKQLKLRLDGARKSVIGTEISPTTVEDYHLCPYKAFVRHGLKLKERENGDVSSLSVGNFIHDVLRGYVNGVKTVTDKSSSDALFYSVAEKALLSPDYKKLLHEKDTTATLTRIINECRSYCYKTYLSLSSNYFKSKTEVSFGDGKNDEYPPIKLLDGKINLKGKIDRVDIGDKYYRIIDYKTGKSDAGNTALFSGSKLQLFLYAKAVGDFNKDKTLAGAYYMPISNAYGQSEEKKMASGKTLGEESAIKAQDQGFYENGCESEFLPVKKHKSTGKLLGLSTEEGLTACMEYATLITENATKQMTDGVILPSPIEGACNYCEYKSMCGYSEVKARAINGVTEDTFIASVENTAKDGGEKDE